MWQNDFVTTNPIIPLFIFLSSLTISLTYFESDLTSWVRVLSVLSEIAFLFIVVNKSFCFRRSYSSNASLFIYVADVLNSPVKLSKAFNLLNVIYICFWRSKSSPFPQLKPWTLWTVDAHTNIKGNWVHLLNRYTDPFFIGISFLHFSIGTKAFCLP